MAIQNSKALYPKSFRPFMRDDIQLKVEPYAEFTDGDNPLSACHEKFSRFNFIITNKGEPVTMNMRWFSDTKEAATSYIEFRERAKLAKDLHLKAICLPTKGPTSPAFTLRFKAGKDIKGKTAAEVLKTDPNGKSLLISQREYLLKNLPAYPSNQQFIDAIDEALTLPRESIENASNSISITLFEVKIRHIENKKNKNGKWFCYEGKIIFTPGADSPLTVDIENYYCAVKKNERGLIMPQISTAEDKNGQPRMQNNQNVNKAKGSINLNFGEALRLFTELDEYFDIQYDSLERSGIKEAAKRLAKSATAQNTTQCSPQNLTQIHFYPAEYADMKSGFAIKDKDGDVLVFNPNYIDKAETAKVEHLKEKLTSGNMVDFTCKCVVSTDRKLFTMFA